MEDKKDLGKLFKERLANAEAEPSTALWSQIEKTLDQKQKRRGFIWLWLGAFTILTFLSIAYFSNQSSNTPVLDQPSNPIYGKSDTLQQNKTVSGPNDKRTNNGATTDQQLKKTLEANQDGERKNGATRNMVNVSNTKNSKSKKGKLTIHEATIQKEQKTSQNGNLKQEEPIRAGREQEISSGTMKVTEKTLYNTRSNADEEDAQEILLDSIPNKVVEKKKRLAKEQDLPKKKKDNPKKWLLSIQGGPNMYANLSNTLPFDDLLADRQLRPGISYSYGALINIPISDKYLLRFGYRKTNLKLYANKAVHIADTITGQYQSIVNSRALSNTRIALPNYLTETLSPDNEFKIEQNVDYYVFPFEVMYRIKEGRLGIDAIAGSSIMALGNTKINVESQVGKDRIGSSTYLKKFTIAPTLGVGIKYQLFDGISIDAETMLQYQPNAFESSFKNANPIIFSLVVGTTIRL